MKTELVDECQLNELVALCLVSGARTPFWFQDMKIQFQVIKDGSVVFEVTTTDANRSYVPDLTAVALEELKAEHPEVSLFDDDVILKWVEV